MSNAETARTNEELYLFDEQYPNAPIYMGDGKKAVAFKSECPPDAKVKVENLFSFKRKQGDLVLSAAMLLLALFFLTFFWTETGWDKRKLPDQMGTYLAYQLGLTEIEGRVTRFGRILKQSWVAPMLCLLLLVPTAVMNFRNAWFVHNWRKRFQLPVSPTYEFEQWIRALEFIAYFILYTLVVPILGYLVSTIFFGLFLTWRLGYRTPQWLCISIASSFVIVLVFRTFLQIKTPVNIWLYDQLPVAARSFMLANF